jgi:fucose permease
MDASSTLAPPPARRDLSVIGLICAAHFVSHVHIFILPPLFPFLKDALGVSYVELGLIITVFNVATAVTQTPTGFLVDRIGPFRLLVGGLVLGSLSLAAAGLAGSYTALLVAFLFAGLANSVYHPADYSILSSTVQDSRIGRAFSFPPSRATSARRSHRLMLASRSPSAGRLRWWWRAPSASRWRSCCWCARAISPMPSRGARRPRATRRRRRGSSC